MKLFGKIISLPQYAVDSCSIDDFDCIRHHQSSATTTITAGSQDNNKNTEGKLTGTKQEDDSTNMTVEESIEPDTVSGTSDDNKTSVVENETLSSNSSKKEDLDDTSEEKTLKKPDKIVPCPRCNSMDTKFCYYNNYNVNQPRHFCKKCQRYWTAGGTMRNVPVGSGRRKNKNTATVDYSHIMISDALQAARVDLANGIHIPTLKANGAVLAFGSEKPLCGSMVTDLNLAERSYNHFRNGFLEPEQRITVPSGGKEIGKDNSIVTSSTTTNSTETGGTAESVVGNCEGQGYLSHVPPFPGPPWSYPWNAPQWRTPLPPPAFNHPGFPVSFYPAPPYWGCAPPGPWNMPWLPPAPSSSDNSTLSMSPTSPTLGKHSRDSNILSPRSLAKEEPPVKKNKESGRVLIPKTLRIDDPNESAKRSIWSTLGIKHDKVDGRTSLFKPFPSKADQRNHITDTSLVLQANPAAYSRSQSFQEST